MTTYINLRSSEPRGDADHVPARICTDARSSAATEDTSAQARTAVGDRRRICRKTSGSSRSGSGTDTRTRAWLISSGRDVNHGEAYASSTARKHRWRSDRKSTRLNSSHVKISYAVFCLKKKK